MKTQERLRLAKLRAPKVRARLRLEKLRCPKVGVRLRLELLRTRSLSPLVVAARSGGNETP